MKTHYKCFQFNKDIEKLKKCRKKFDIKPIPLNQNKQLQPFESWKAKQNNKVAYYEQSTIRIAEWADKVQESKNLLNLLVVK